MPKRSTVKIMGILNITPDSFSDGGKYYKIDRAFARAELLVGEGADIIDIGGESTRPGATPVSIAEELNRVLPIIQKIRKNHNVPLSIDTRNGAVAREAIAAGASIVNDVSGLKHDKSMAGIIAKNRARVIIMHMRGTPQDMQSHTKYTDIVKDVINEVSDSLRIATDAGIDNENIVIDPGLGFAKLAEHNFEILNRLAEFKSLGYPICVGSSRKSFIKNTLPDAEEADILSGTIATCIIATLNGASFLRVHDVGRVKAAIDIVSRIFDKGTKIECS